MRLAALAAVSMTFLATTSPTEASPLRLVGVSDEIDHAAERANQVVQSARDAALAVVDETNSATRERLEQVDAIVDEALLAISALPADAEGRILNILADAEKKAYALQQAFFDDMNAAIWEAECGAKRTLLTELQAALGGTGDILSTGQITVMPPLPIKDSSLFCKVSSSHCKTELSFEIYDNFEETADNIRKAVLDNLAGLDDEAPAYSVVKTYNYLATLGRRTTCFVAKGDNAWLRDYVDYSAMAEEWVKYVKPER